MINHVEASKCNALVIGEFLDKFKFRSAIKNGLVKRDQIKREILSQIKLYRELFASNPLSVDGHQHVHIVPGVFQPMYKYS